jgi:hypothetical protein
MFLQLHHVLNSVRVSFQRSWAESWPFGYGSCETALRATHEVVPNGPYMVNHPPKKNYMLTQRHKWAQLMDILYPSETSPISQG